jgi:NTE family protein
MPIVANKVLGLAMTGGGARGAYQAGVLKRIGEMPWVESHGNPFPIIGGASAGAVNGAALAAGSDEFSEATRTVADLWGSLKPNDVFRCDLASQAHNSLIWILDLSFGGMMGGGNARSLLDATPLRHYLNSRLDCSRIQENIRRGYLYALAISATNYNSGISYQFVQGKRGHPIWNRSRRVTLATKITVDHICASAAIPLVFQPVRLQTAHGTAYFGDGCLRLQQPLSPIIRLGAEKIFAIGVRGEVRTEREAPARDPSLAQVLGVLFNVMFLDHLASDVEHLVRLNQMLKDGLITRSATASDSMRPLEVMLVTPSVYLTEVAAHHQKDMPYLIQYFVNGLARDAASCSDLMSYLLFTPKYTRELIQLGYEDADERADEIEEYLFAGKAEPDRAPASRSYKSRIEQSAAE